MRIEHDIWISQMFNSDCYREEIPSTPERNRQQERERMRDLQMTSPTIRRQRLYERQAVPQPNFVPRPPSPPGVPAHFQPFQSPTYQYNANLHSDPFLIPGYQYTCPQPPPPPPMPAHSRPVPVPVNQYPGLPRPAIANHD